MSFTCAQLFFIYFSNNNPQGCYLSLSLSLFVSVCCCSLSLALECQHKFSDVWLIDWLLYTVVCVFCFILIDNCVQVRLIFFSLLLFWFLSIFFYYVHPTPLSLSLFIVIRNIGPPSPKKNTRQKWQQQQQQQTIPKKKMHNIPNYLKSHFKNYYFLFIWKLNFPSLRLIFVQSGVVLRLRLVLQKVFTNKGKHLLFFFLHLICTSPFRFDFFQIKRENRIIRFRLLFDFFFSCYVIFFLFI